MKWRGKEHHAFYEWFEKADKEELKEYIYNKRYENFPLWKKWVYGILVVLAVLIFYAGVIFTMSYFEERSDADDWGLALVTVGDYFCEDYGGRLSYKVNDGTYYINCIEKNFKIEPKGAET